MIYLQTTYVFWEAYFEYLESCDFPAKMQISKPIDVSVFMFDLRMINMSSECEYDWYWKKSACSTEYEVCDSFALLTHQQTSYSGSAGWYFRNQSIHIQITCTFTNYIVTCDRSVVFSINKIDHHDITVIFLKVVLNTINKTTNNL